MNEPIVLTEKEKQEIGWRLDERSRFVDLLYSKGYITEGQAIEITAKYCVMPAPMIRSLDNGVKLDHGRP